MSDSAHTSTDATEQQVAAKTAQQDKQAQHKDHFSDHGWRISHTKQEAEWRNAQDAGWLVRIGTRLLHFVERQIARSSRVGTVPVFDREQFPWVREIESKTDVIRAELDAILHRRDELPNFQDVTPGVDAINQDNNWKTWFFFGYGVRIEQNCAACPETTRILQQIPGMKTAFFSILAPGKHIPEHFGPYNGVLRYHLGLQVPKQAEHCRIRVHNQIYHWKTGESLIFDDTYNHEVWNDTDEQRVVLFVDFVRPCRWPGRFFNWCVLTIAASLPMLKTARKQHLQWEKSFFAK
ncbi:MAG: aspartyl/asparaginyl beta-hydroxylase domain-containing protein [Gammaproteobacteria bacterium]|nr:aspartyl/asparaginyl beta-hydroxylase domain-containing protein [Gammaproteobacteria bacterium]